VFIKNKNNVKLYVQVYYIECVTLLSIYIYVKLNCYGKKYSRGLLP